MVSLSSEWIRKRWRYAVKEEFHRVPEDPAESIGEVATWAPGHPHIFPRGGQGEAERFLPFEDKYDDWADYALNSDQSKLAVVWRTKVGRLRGGESALHVFDVASGTRKVLKGHRGGVGGILFSSTDPNLLLTASSSTIRGDDSKPEILIWDLSSDMPEPGSIPDAELQRAAGVAVDAMSDLKLSEEEQVTLRTKTHEALSRVVADRVIRGIPKLQGRLPLACNAAPFSRDGRYVLYEPGERPDSNGRDERWILRIYDLRSRTDTVTLKGHTDSIMWVGWSHTDKWIMSVAWDRTIRVWDSQTGEEKWQFKTKNQNWAGCFGPPTKEGDAEWVIGTSGDGLVHCWSLDTGEELWHHPYANRGHVWTRAVAVSPSGRYVIAGGERGAGVDILDLHRAKGDTPHREAATSRVLGVGDLRAPLSPEEEDETDPEKKKEAEKNATRIIVSMFNVREVRFVDEHRFVWNGYPDSGIHMYDIRTNQMYRWAPEYPPLPTPDTEQPEDPVSCLGFELGEQNGKKVLYTVHGDGLRSWDISA